jgi:acid phosphatase (class A)
MTFRHILPALLAGACLAAPASLNAQQVSAAKPAPSYELLRAEDFPVVGLLPSPPARGSKVEKLELAWLHALITETSPERMEKARWDAAHEDPSLFNEVLGVDLKTLPATWALLETVQNDTDMGVDAAKDHFARLRPWAVDPTLPSCKSKKAVGSYPSGHSGLGYSAGLILANLVPAKAQAILDRARDYALSREMCAAHFPSDTEASHVIGTIAAQKILADPRAAQRIAAARAELAHLNAQ